MIIIHRDGSRTSFNEACQKEFTFISESSDFGCNLKADDGIFLQTRCSLYTFLLFDDRYYMVEIFDTGRVKFKAASCIEGTPIYSQFQKYPCVSRIIPMFSFGFFVLQRMIKYFNPDRLVFDNTAQPRGSNLGFFYRHMVFSKGFVDEMDMLGFKLTNIERYFKFTLTRKRSRILWYC